MKFSALQQNRIVYRNAAKLSSNGFNNKTVSSIVKLFPLGTVDDLMHHCTRPSTLCDSASGRPRHLGVMVLTIQQTGMK